MNEKAAEYRAKLDEHRKSDGGWWRTPADLRQEITVWAAELRSSGYGTRSIAAAIQLNKTTLRRWLSQYEAGDGCLRQIRIEKEPFHDGSLAVVTPAGFRLEGLDVEQAITVLRRL